MVLAAPLAPAAPASRAPAAAPASVGGVSAAEWTIRWWRWTRSFPDGLEPYLDRDGRRCAMGQDDDGPVWFLAGTDGRFDARRRCRVPAGKHLLVPVINMYFHGPRLGENAMSCAQVKRRAAVNNDYLVSAVVLLDGKPLARPERLISRCFDPQAERDDAGPDDRRGVVRAAADGYWLLLPPLAPGPHRLSVGANYGNPDDPDYGRMLQNFEYELQVGDPAI
ncbi:hypothetical protein [Lysobacter enzymogenes]|uniref:hypothetical protein n=1 Tax=Lysobacter enzymogenes TaxID=69 RepID=UPI001A96CE6C|nr:hypothetical protein [Lysobacter enzymogenes]QQP97670.1 hypothetical protein JHW38_06550 [Lysobacter enzymogenes]